MKLDDLKSTSGEWLRGTGPESDIVMCSRIRLARNLNDFPFINRASKLERSEVESTVRNALGQVDLGLSFFDVNGLSKLDRLFLVERQLISRELENAEGPRGVAVASHENVSIMINEEDHLRIQVMLSGLSLQDVWDRINRIDDQIEEKLSYAFSPQLGYLTACPTNVGTGIRVGVMLHLPALAQTKSIDKVFRALQKINLAVRGLYGEGTQAFGDFYQISNQQTLGKSEQELIRNLSEVVPQIIDYERKARQQLVSERRQYLHDQVSRAYGVLKTAHTISSEETMQLLSSVRMGINLGLIDDLEIPTVNELFIHTQPAHLQKIQGAPLEVDERNVARASYLRKRLSNGQVDEDQEELDCRSKDRKSQRIWVDVRSGISPDRPADLVHDGQDQFGGDEAGERLGLAEPGDLLDQAAGNVRKLAIGHQEDGLDRRVEALIGQRHAEFVLHVREGPEPAKDHPGAGPSDELDGQLLERLDGDVRVRCDDQSRQRDALVDREERLLVGVDPDRHDQMVEQRPAAADDVEVPQRERVERAGEDGGPRGVGGRGGVDWGRSGRVVMAVGPVRVGRSWLSGRPGGPRRGGRGRRRRCRCAG